MQRRDHIVSTIFTLLLFNFIYRLFLKLFLHQDNMAFRPYQLVQTKSFLNNHPGEVLKHQPDVGFPVNDDQSVSVELSLGLGVSGSTSSITKQSSLPMMKRYIFIESFKLY